MSRLTIGRPGKRFAAIVASLLILLALLVVAMGWYYSSVVHDGLLTPDYAPSELNLEVVSVLGNRIVLREREGESVGAMDDALLWGLDAEAGYGQAGPTIEVDGDEVTREFVLLDGVIEPGDLARLDSFAFEGDPSSARGLAYREVAVPGLLGDFPAWQLDGDPETWAIFVHGWRSDREEALRILPAVQALGLTSLVITYRNDEVAPPSPDGLIRWGATEWQDVESAVLYAESQGARSVVLYGYSMGGGTVMRFLQQSEHAVLVAGAVLDAPVLDFDALIDFQAGRRNIPGVLADVGMWFAEQRFDLDRDAMNHLAHVDRVEAPILLFHGTEDDRAPISTSDRLARERPDIVEYHVIERAGHVQAWNTDPDAYEQTVRAFLQRAVASR